jgi:cobyrinic acid a,c-diamide synthase
LSNGIPGIVIAGAESGVGKTSIAIGLACALARRGLRVQSFKVGPDFLDPSYLTLASGRPCYNLDGWMTGESYVRELFARTTASADIAVIEGVMGLFDGASPSSMDGSTAEIAAWLGAPVILVVNASGVARSFAATVKGFAGFERDVTVAGVIANRVGSERHKALLAESLKSAALPPLVGAIPRGALPELPSRHLGLVTAQPGILSPDALRALGRACEEHTDIGLLLKLANEAALCGPTVRGARANSCPGERPGSGESHPASKARIGVARDEAFHFYYPDNLEALETAGAELVFFSPVKDREMPPGLNGLYVGGGYPEESAEALSGNTGIREAVRAFCLSGRPVYAECGGLMYLSESLETREGRRFEMAGVLPAQTRMLPRLRSLGYVSVTLEQDSLWGAKGTELRGHEFHYSELVGDPARDGGWTEVYEARNSRSGPSEAQGFQKGNVLASYVHLHFASRPGAAESFIGKCQESL